MQIVIVNSFFPPWRGGAETYVGNLAQSLKLRGNDVTVLCADAPRPPGTIREAGVTVRRHRLIGRIYGTPVMPGLIEDLLTIDADIFHANFPSPYIASTVAWASKHRGVPAVLTWHNDLPAVTFLASMLIRVHDNALLPAYIHAYRRVIATTHAYAQQSRVLSSLGQLVTVIPNGVSCDRFNPKIDTTKLKAKLGVENRFTIIFVGALTKWHRYKGLDVLLDAMKIAIGKRKNLQVLIVGDGELREEYRAMATQLGMSANVLFLGDVPDAELSEYYAASDVAVLPSKNQSEGFGLTILEANATGKPVVASNVGGIPSVVTHGYNGLLVPPNDTSRLAEAILYLSKNHDAVAAMGRNGRKVAEQHDWKGTAALTEQVYLQALATQASDS